MACLQRTPLLGTWLQRTPLMGNDGCGRSGSAFVPQCGPLSPFDMRALPKHLVFVGDSLVRYQFDSLLALLRRKGCSLRCRPASQPEPAWAHGRLAEIARGNRSSSGLMPLDCLSRPPAPRRLSFRLLPILPPADALAAHLDALFAPLAHGDSVVYLNVGLWYNQRLASAMRSTGRRGAVGQSEGDGDADAVFDMYNASVRALASLAVQRERWPRLLWREHLPQHFAGGGAFRGKVTVRCEPLEEEAARRIYDRMVGPVLRATRAAASVAARVPSSRGLVVVPAFWPLVSRHRDHLGLSSQTASQPRHRADCTHWLPCSAAAVFLNQLLSAALRART